MYDVVKGRSTLIFYRKYIEIKWKRVEEMPRSRELRIISSSCESLPGDGFWGLDNRAGKRSLDCGGYL